MKSFFLRKFPFSAQVMFLPFGYLIDQYRWALFDGSIDRDEMNQGWWELRRDLIVV